jgi:hypothetical protein
LREGREKARNEAYDEGLREGLLRGIEVACDILGVELTADRRAELATLNTSGFKARLARLHAERRW